MGTVGVPEYSSRHPEVNLRLKRVTAAKHLNEEMVFRRSDLELGVYEDQRWSEPPAEYVRRALAFALFERRGFTRVHATNAATLDVEVTAFEETLSPAGVVLEVVVQLHKGDRALLQETFTLREPLTGHSEGVEPPSKFAVASALGKTLGELVTQIAQRVFDLLEA
jgi:ABC-type uncharacterized transport system auxiliary subunit